VQTKIYCLREAPGLDVFKSPKTEATVHTRTIFHTLKLFFHILL